MGEDLGELQGLNLRGVREHFQNYVEVMPKSLAACRDSGAGLCKGERL